MTEDEFTPETTVTDLRATIARLTRERDEMCVEANLLNAELARLRPVYEAAKAWRQRNDSAGFPTVLHRLAAAVDAATPPEQTPTPEAGT